MLLALSFLPASAGTITGTVRAQGAEPAATGGGGGAYASRRYKFVERVDYEQLRDFVVYIDQVIPGMGLRAKRASMLIEDGVIKQLNVETPGKFEVSDAASMLRSL